MISSHELCSYRINFQLKMIYMHSDSNCIFGNKTFLPAKSEVKYTVVTGITIAHIFHNGFITVGLTLHIYF